MKKILLLAALILALCATPVLAGSAQYPLIANVTLTTANTEYSQAITGMQKFTIQCRTNYDVRFAYVTGKVATPTAPYITIKAGSVFWEDDLSVDKTLYFASSQAGVVVEILYYK